MNLIEAAWRSVFSPKDRRPIYEWALEHTRLQPPLTRTGPFDVSTSRHFIAIFDALQDDARREVNVLKPVRGGGTLVADIWAPWTRSNDPGPFMFVLQTDKIADDHADKVLWPTLESVLAIKAMIQAQDRHSKTGRKIHFEDGNDIHCNGPSTGNLQTNAFRYVVEDEVWLWDCGKIGEADGRVGDFLKLGTSKILRISQGGPRDGRSMRDDDWHRVYHEAEIFEWEIECPSCHGRMLPEMSGRRPDGTFWGLTWDPHKLENGDWDIAKAVPTTRFQCQHCPHPLIDGSRTKQEWNRTGSYRLAAGQNRKRASFHWSALIDFPWDELVELWLNACNAFTRGDPLPKLQFYQKRLAKFMDLETLMKGGLNLRRVVYEVDGKWPEETARFLTIDRQSEGLFWWTVRAWTDEGKSRRLGFGKCFGFAECEEIRKQYKVPPNWTFIDSGFEPKGDAGVYLACIRFGWIALKGDQAPSFIHLIRKGEKTHRIIRSYAPLSHGDPGVNTAGLPARFAKLIRFSKSAMNAAVQELIESKFWEEPASSDSEMDKEYNRQMASRFRRTEYIERTGQTKVFWYEGKDDHARDLANMQNLAAILTNKRRDPADEILSRSEKAVIPN